jgi:hypothetical protein
MRTLLLAGVNALCLATAPAFAQEPTPADLSEIQFDDPGTYTVDTVDPADPFGDLSVDLAAMSDADAVRELLEGLGQDQALDLVQRCVVIIGNTEAHEPSVVTFCALVIKIVGAADAASGEPSPAADDRKDPVSSSAAVAPNQAEKEPPRERGRPAGR